MPRGYAHGGGTASGTVQLYNGAISRTAFIMKKHFF